MKRIVIFPIVLLLLANLPACNEKDETVTPADATPPVGTLTNTTECKTFSGPAFDAGMSSSESCLEYSYDAAERLLHLKHVNAGFNCCPGKLSSDILIEKNTITISEHESEAACRCNCLYDFTYEIRSLPPGSYHIVIVEPYRSPEDPELSVTIDLEAVPTGEFCVARLHYPWGM
jgi:hypothetical protein